MIVDTSAVNLPLDYVRREPTTKPQPTTIHFAEEDWTGNTVRMCELGTPVNHDGTSLFSDVTCKTCRKRGAWLYGWEK
jgi:hypothetical protein